MLNTLVMMAALTVSQFALAGSFDNFVYVPPDYALKIMGQTRDGYNKVDPKAEKLWRQAWAAEGTKQDTTLFATLRRDTTKPSDMVPASQSASAPTPKKR